MTLYRQGDVLLQRVRSKPRKAKKLKPEQGRVILAHGEVTGHHHSLDCGTATLFAVEGDEDRFLVLEADGQLVHQEHDTIDLQKGTYRVRRQREYSPEEIRRVAD